ncbi:MAG: hybrid sensor histidine kinase/response regulator [Thioploca sp.]|nr:hybrid sensor histidine kinase/response regulator [Thioploca sp.]
MMPDLDGFEVCRQLKQNLQTHDIPIIFLTARVEQEDIIKGFELGAVDYVTKPFNHKELISRVRTHIELKAAREALALKIEELQQANITKEKLLSIISHDLVNLFNSLMNFSLLLTESEELSVEQQNKYLLMISQSSNQGYHLLKNLLDWLRNQTGKIQVIPVSVNLKWLIERNIEFLSSQAKNKNITLCSTVESATTVFADQNMLDTVIRNLLANAIKFTPNFGKVEITSQQQASMMELSVLDTGIGIKPEDIQRIFQGRYYTTMGTGNEKGTGIGLNLCKEFVEKNGGNIGVESEIGKGSRFYVHLPLPT